MLYNQDNCLDRIKELEDKVEKLIEVVKLQQKRLKRNDELNTWVWYRGESYYYANSEGPGHGKKKRDTYYKKFD